MDARQQRGMTIAASCKLVQKGRVWLVPSQSGSAKYTVCPDMDAPYCSCPDHEETGKPCKHIYAVRVTMQRETAKDGTVTETTTTTVVERKTYKQDWPAYNIAQTEEKARFLRLLFDLCAGADEAPMNKGGRHRTPMGDMVFACCLKVYTTLSSRRFGTDLADATEKGYLCKKLHPVMVNAFLERDILTPVLKALIEQSALPLKAIETTFAPDSTGFSTSRFVRWFDEKYGRERSGRDWVKCHAICGTKTQIITAIEIGERASGDCPYFKPLVEKTAETFRIERVCADKAYLSNENLELVDRLGGTAFIPFKSNSTSGALGSLWEKMHLYYQLNREDFLKHYHARSCVESAFSMTKAKFRDSVRSTNDTAMKNEVLCKVLCHNICCVIQSQVELGVEPLFWPDGAKGAAQSVMPVAAPAASSAVSPTARSVMMAGA
jgi:transposase